MPSLWPAVAVSWANALTLSLTLASLHLVHVHAAIQLDLTNPDSIKAAASTAAFGMMSYYKGNDTGQVPGLLPAPWYWWEAGAMFGQLIDYWSATGDATYNADVTQGLLFQVGPNDDYMPPNQTSSEGNDDQVFWAFATMTAAELNFPNPPSGSPSWLGLAQAVFNLQADRWDTSTCGGGLRWQIESFAPGYDYKNAVSNGGLFQLGARLARYTGNQTYADWAEKEWNWFASSPMLSGDYQIDDGVSTTNNCSNADGDQWTYNYGVWLAGAAYMYNYTNGSSTWLDRVNGILNGTQRNFFLSQYGGNIMEEPCEVLQNCDQDQPSFKAYLSRWMALTTQLVPVAATTNFIMTKLAASAQGAAQQCSGGAGGTTCGRRWWQSTWDGESGVGEQMSAMAVFQANLISNTSVPVTADQGGSSPSDPSAGSGDTDLNGPSTTTTGSTKGDKAAAAILTVLVLIGTIAMLIWIM